MLYRDYKGKIPRDECSAFIFFHFNFIGNCNENSDNLTLWYFPLGYLAFPTTQGRSCSLCLGSSFLQISPGEVVSVHIHYNFFLPVISYEVQCNAKSYTYQLKMVLLSRQTLIIWARKTTQLMWTFLCDRSSQWVKQVPYQGRQNTFHTGNIRIKESRSLPCSLCVCVCLSLLRPLLLSLPLNSAHGCMHWGSSFCSMPASHHIFDILDCSRLITSFYTIS